MANVPDTKSTTFDLGIDVGLRTNSIRQSGAFAFYLPAPAGQPTELHIYEMPVSRRIINGRFEHVARFEIDYHGLLKLLRTHPVRHAWVERVNTSSQMGVVSAGTFMSARAAILMGLAAAGITWTEVDPNVWKRRLVVPRHKRSSRERATALFPEHAGKWPKHGDHNRAEAAMIALYGYLESNGAWPGGRRTTVRVTVETDPVKAARIEPPQGAPQGWEDMLS